MRYRIFTFIIYTLSSAIGIYRTRQEFKSMHAGCPVYWMVDDHMRISLMAVSIAIWIIGAIWLINAHIDKKSRFAKGAIIAVGIIPAVAAVVYHCYSGEMLEKTPVHRIQLRHNERLPRQ